VLEGREDETKMSAIIGSTFWEYFGNFMEKRQRMRNRNSKERAEGFCTSAGETSAIPLTFRALPLVHFNEPINTGT
jgi:hypothetical protein